MVTPFAAKQKWATVFVSLLLDEEMYLERTKNKIYINYIIIIHKII